MRFTAPLVAGLVAAVIGLSAHRAEAGYSHASGRTRHGYSGGHRSYGGGYSGGYSGNHGYSGGYSGNRPSGYNYGYRPYGGTRYYRPNYYYRRPFFGFGFYGSAYPYGYGYGYNNGYGNYQQTEQRGAPENDLSLGFRGLAGAAATSDAIIGAGAFVRLRSGFLGLEGSVDAAQVSTATDTFAANRLQLLGAGLLYLNPRDPVRLYGLAGGGVSFENATALTLQAGAGLEIDLGPRALLTADGRFLADFGSAGGFADEQFVTANLGLSFRF